MEMTEVQYEATVLQQGTVLVSNTFPDFRKAMRATIDANLTKYGPAIFFTSTKRLSTAYVGNFTDKAVQQHHDCAACRDFIRKFGTAVIIDENNKPVSLLWDPETVPEEFKASVSAMKQMAERGVIARAVRWDVTGAEWGEEMKGGWNHLHYHFDPVELSARMQETGVSVAALIRAKENAQYLEAGLKKYPTELIRKAARFMVSGRIDRKEAFSPWLEWLLVVSAHADAINDSQRRKNMLWNAVARLPSEGWASFSDSSIARLMDMIEEGRPDPTIAHVFNQMTRPVNYKNATSELTEGQANRAEQVLTEKGLIPSLDRRLATYEEIRQLAIWEPPAAKEATNQPKSLFGDLVGKKPGERNDDDIGNITRVEGKITMTKFIATVLSDVTQMFVYATAPKLPLAEWFGPEHDDAKPIFPWDKEEDRYPFCWTQHEGGTLLSEVGLNGGWLEVTSVMKAPWMKSEEGRKFGHVLALVLKDAHSFPSTFDLFPDAVLSELHEIRAAIHSLNMSRTVAGKMPAVVGLAIAGQTNMLLRVKTKLGWFAYEIDRMD